MIEEASRQLGAKPRVSTVSPTMMRIVGLFSPAVREMGEMMYEFTHPYIVDSSQERTRSGALGDPDL